VPDKLSKNSVEPLGSHYTPMPDVADTRPATHRISLRDSSLLCFNAIASNEPTRIAVGFAPFCWAALICFFLMTDGGS
jgi:hypothetical protein